MAKHLFGQDDRAEIERMQRDLERELAKKSPALAVASRLLHETSKEETALADLFVASTYTLGKNLRMNAGAQKAFEPTMLAYRDSMRRAHRFALDDDFTRMSTAVSSTTTPEKLLSRIQFATLPYEVTWIEFDLHVKIRTMREVRKLDPNAFIHHDVSPRMGCLMHRINQTDAVCELIGSWGHNDVIAPNMMCYFFSTRDEVRFTKFSGCRPFDLDDNFEAFADATTARTGLTREEQKQIKDIGHIISGGSMWGYSGEKISHDFVSGIDQLLNLNTPEFLRRHGEAGFSRLFHSIKSLIGDAPGGLGDTMRTELAEFTGMMRWVCTVLAMLNEVPVRAELVQQRHQLAAGLTRRIKTVDYHRLTLRLPKTRPIPFIERKLSNVERKHKAHEVRSHWRTYLHEVHCIPDEHSWEYDNDHGYRLCGKCMAYGRLILEHVRGDPSLGWVKKDYVIKSATQT